MIRSVGVRATEVLVAIAIAGASMSGSVAGQAGQTSDRPALRLENLEADVEFLASGELEGRGSGTTQQSVAAKYLAATLKRFGVGPFTRADDARADRSLDGYFQTFSLVEHVIENVDLAVTRGPGRVSLQREVDFQIAMGEGVAVEDAPVVFAGFGIVDAERSYDDLAGIDLRGRVALILNQPGSAAADTDFFLDRAVSRRYFGAAGEMKRFMRLKAAGARAILLAPDPWNERTALVEAQRLRAASGRNVGFASSPSPQEAAERLLGIPVVRVSGKVAADLMSTAGNDLTAVSGTLHGGRGPASAVLANVRVSLRFSKVQKQFVSANILGRLEGSDAALKSQVVLVGAHYDHLGRRGETVWPGADDNASGVAAALEVARTLAALPARPRRTILIAFWSAEELGLLGSRHFLATKDSSPASIAAAINIDMVGRPRTIDRTKPVLRVIGSKGIDVAELLGLLQPPRIDIVANAGSPESVSSDHLTFLAASVPTIVLHHGWRHEDYHQPSDTADKIDFAYLSDVAGIAAGLAIRLANQ